jgi:hypothetical protein
MNVIESAINGVRQDGIRLSFIFPSQVGADPEFRDVVASGHRSCPQESRVIGYLKLMARKFKPVRFFVMMAVAAFIVCGVTAFYTHRAEHGRTAEERQAYWIGEKAGEQAPRDAKLPTPAALNMMAQKYFKQQGSGNQSDWNLAFEHGYEDGFKKTHPPQ